MLATSLLVQCRRRPRTLFSVQQQAAFFNPTISTNNNANIRGHQQCVRSFAWAVDSETGVVSYKKKACFQTIVGLEIHAQLDIPSKLFSAAKVSTSLSQAPNTLVHPLDLAVPGILPVCSKAAVQAAVLTAAALQCEISPVSRFERKHYHYADLPFGYQVTQQRWPIARNGSLRPASSLVKKPHQQQQKPKSEVEIGIDRIQLEQDTGKTTTTKAVVADSDDGTTTTVTRSLVDFNRAGCALVEIVMNPDVRSANQAVQTVETLRQLLKHIGTCNGRMEEGSFRVDLNVSIHPLRDPTNGIDDFVPNLNNRVEVKNLNSLRQVQQATEYEALRQARIVWEASESGGNGTRGFRETRTFDVKSGKTVLIRSKEGEEDYRFMPEPDLPPVVLGEQVFDGRSLEDFLAENLPELPDAARQRLVQEYKLDDYTASVIAGDPPAIRIYDDAVQAAKRSLPGDESNHLKEAPIFVANLLCNELFSLIREEEEESRLETQGGNIHSNEYQYSTVSGQQLGELAALQITGTISATMAKRLLHILFHEEVGRQPQEVAQERGLELISDAERLRTICRETIDEHPDQLQKYKKGGKYIAKMKKFLVGKAMARSQGNAHPERIHEALEDVLQEVAPGVQE